MNPTPGSQGHGLRIFIKKSKFLCLYHQDPLRNFIYILHVGRYKSRVLLSMIPIPGYDLEVKVTDLEISYKSKKNLHLSFYTIKTFC